MLFIIFLLLNLASIIKAQEASAAQIMDTQFKPKLLRVELLTDKIRPGETLGMTFHFINEGQKPALKDYHVFVHLEYPEPDCQNIVFSLDHDPAIPTTAWQPGKIIEDGPHGLLIPEDATEGIYHLHVGVYQWQPQHIRFCETYAAKININKQAPPLKSLIRTLKPEELRRRQRALQKRLGDTFRLENQALRFSLSKATGAYQLYDKRTKVRWHSNPFTANFAVIQLRNKERMIVLPVERFDTIKQIGRNKLVAKFKPKVDNKQIGLELTFKMQLLSDGGLRFEYSATENNKSEWSIDCIRLLDEALWVTDSQNGYVALPNRMGVLLFADDARTYTRRLPLYSRGGYSMMMLGLVKENSAALITWTDPYVTVEIQSSLRDHPMVDGMQIISASLILRKSAKNFEVRLLGRGGYVEIAKAYREIAQRRGLLKTWKEKLQEVPYASKLFGAPEFKLFTLVRTIPGSRFHHGEGEQVHLGYTFEEAAKIAEHLKYDVGIDKALFVLAGWIHRGYDNQHPDILPAAPECGGNEKLAECARRVKALGYLFGLHDNYQDIYRDAPSWDEAVIMRHPDGSLYLGGNWAGGQAWLVCSKKGLELAQRPQNLPAVKQLFAPTAYFIDTTFAAPPYECFSPEHPLSLQDDINFKSKLCDYAISKFGVFGSEEGREWAVPHAHYFEGLMSHRTRRDEAQIVVPLFELVYRDCIALLTHQGDRATSTRIDYILDHILYGRMPLYHLPNHLYYEKEGELANIIDVKPEILALEAVAPRTFKITYHWTVRSDVGVRYRCFVHFTDSDGEIKFQNDHDLSPPTEQWRAGMVITDGPYIVEVPKGLSGNFQIRLGLFNQDGRACLPFKDDGGLRYLVGLIKIRADTINFIPTPLKVVGDTLCFVRGESEKKPKNLIDRFICNTYEILSPLNELTAQIPMTDHKFLNKQRTVEQTTFGNNKLRVVVNFSDADFIFEGIKLPPNGFLVSSHRFIAFHAMNYAGISYKRPTCFTIRSLDNLPIEQSRQVRIYWVFGEQRVRLWGKDFQAQGELIVRR